jgi:hypothetical protein
MRSAILLVDRDLGFLFWLGLLLDRAGYDTLPANGIPDAYRLLRDLHPNISLLILDCSLPGAADFIAGMRRCYGFIRTICLGNHCGEECVSGVDAVCYKISDTLEEAKAAWLETVRDVLPQGAALERAYSKAHLN